MDVRKQILDPCCGARMFYFDKKNPLVDYRDNRELHVRLTDRTLDVSPDTIDDVTNLEGIKDGTYPLVIFNPPFLKTAGPNGWMKAKYGVLPKDWQGFLQKSFAECWRVVKKGGNLVFKWDTTKIPIEKVRPFFPSKPVYESTAPNGLKSHWIIFHKGNDFGAKSSFQVYVPAEQIQGDWITYIKRSFKERWQRIPAGGILVFEWENTRLPARTLTSQILGVEPVIGCRRPSRTGIQWMLFYKSEAERTKRKPLSRMPRGREARRRHLGINPGSQKRISTAARRKRHG